MSSENSVSDTDRKILEDLVAINRNQETSNCEKIRAITALFFSTKPTSHFVIGRMMIMMEKYATDDLVARL